MTYETPTRLEDRIIRTLNAKAAQLDDIVGSDAPSSAATTALVRIADRDVPSSS